MTDERTRNRTTVRRRGSVWAMAGATGLLLALVGCNLNNSRNARYQPDLVYPPNRSQPQLAPPQQFPGGVETRERTTLPEMFPPPGQSTPTPLPSNNPPSTFAPPGSGATETYENRRQPLDPIPLPEPPAQQNNQRLLPRLLSPSAGLLSVRPSSTGSTTGWIVLDVQAPQQAPLGSGAPVNVVVRNVGQRIVESLSISCEVPQGVSLPGTVERSVSSPVRRLIPGESTELKFTPRCDTLGRQTVRFVARWGNTEVASRIAEIDFVPRQVELQVVGPNRRTVGQRAEVNLRIANLTSRPLEGVKVRMRYDSPLAVRELTLGGQRSEGHIEWTVGDLQPEESIEMQAEFECRIPTSEACVGITVSSSDVLNEEREVFIRIDPPSAELQVDLADEADPVRNGDEFVVVMTAKNSSLQPVTDVRASLQLPAAAQFGGLEVLVGDRRISLPYEVRDGRVNVAPVAMLVSGEAARFRFLLKATQPGTHAVRGIARHSGSRQLIELTEPFNVAR